MIEVCLDHRAQLIPELVMQRSQVEEGPANTIVKIAAGVAGAGERDTPVQPQPDCMSPHSHDNSKLPAEP